MDKFFLILIFVFFVIKDTFAQQQSFETFLKTHLSESFYEKTQLGMSIVDLSDGKQLSGYQENKWFVPASSLKIITSFVAYSILGKNFQYKTHLVYTGNVDKSGILYGNVILIGSGDPTLGSGRWSQKPDMEALLILITEEIKKAGIKEIKGKVLVDSSIFDDDPVSPTWQWNDIANYYGGGAHGFNISENEYHLFFHRDKEIGQKAGLDRIEPYIPGLEMENEVTVGPSGSGDQSYIFTKDSNYDKVVRGSIPYGKNIFKTKGAIPEPAKFMAYRMYDNIKKAGIICSKDAFDQAGSREAVTDTLVSFVSPELSQIIKTANAESINLYCESLLKTMGYLHSGKGRRTTGLEVVNRYFDDLGLKSNDVFLEDGSGLSARNYVSPRFFTTFLYKMVARYGQKEVSDMLPQAGEQGTVKGLLADNPEVQSYVRAKSGSMTGIYSLTGICKTSKGKWVTFCLMLNGSPAKESKQNRKQLEKILLAIHKYY
ncbi:MAG: D-alanyl-D-alanine carboxypeptidase/D-alanyl-D-alanine-endopeptidase [Saprospiraceae bacterium]|nr:D-alanyl-D-alanine carboxypeptidase/D-alanyl-D-alanine-endopeptidase [Saprospiraceae bacterium]